VFPGQGDYSLFSTDEERNEKQFYGTDTCGKGNSLKSWKPSGTFRSKNEVIIFSPPSYFLFFIFLQIFRCFLAERRERSEWFWSDRVDGAISSFLLARVWANNYENLKKRDKIDKAGNPCWRGRISTDDLLALTSSCQVIFMLKLSLIFS
jgi:hypothetical protein